MLTIAILGLVISSVKSSCLSGATPIPLAANSTCVKGFYCPNANSTDPTTWPQMCTPTSDCQRQRLLGKKCVQQSRYEPVICEEGYYCPTQSSKVVCPAGSFCPMGSTLPFSCSPLAYCPEGSKFQTNLAGFLAFVLVDLILLIFFLGKRRKEKDAKATTKQAAKDQDGQGLEKVIGYYKKAYQGMATDMLIEFQEIQLTRSGKKILQDITGRFKPKTTTAIMGGSGAGKRTRIE
jgi:hypothetical protein